MTESASKLRSLRKRESALRAKLSAIENQIEEQRAKLKAELTATAPKHPELQDFLRYTNPITPLLKSGSSLNIILFRESHLPCTPEVSGYFSGDTVALSLLEELKKAWVQNVVVKTETFQNCLQDRGIKIHLRLRRS